VATSRNGRTLVYTDGVLNAIGIVGIEDPENRKPLGTVAVGGEPTSVTILGNNLALVAVNTSESFTNTSGKLVVVRLKQKRIVGEIELGGQPDSISLSPNNRYAAIAIEEERDEGLCVGGDKSGFPVPEDRPETPGDITDDACEAAGGQVGIIPQTKGSPLDTNGTLNNPPGFLAIIDIHGHNPNNWDLRKVDLRGLSTLAPSDPEPEFVDINRHNRAVVTLQENNHMVVVDLPSGRVVRDFDLGTVDLRGVDTIEDGIISMTGNLDAVPREPDAVAWIPGWRYPLIATANEGDLFGGSRGFSVFGPGGRLLFDTAAQFEEIAVQHGHYPEDRSENKGAEPEAIEFGRFKGRDYLFVGSERGSFVAVYQLGPWGPRFAQILPGPLAPEGLVAIPDRNLVVATGEADDPSFGVRSSIMIYALVDTEPSYPQIVSDAVDGKPIPWSALSGMDALPDGDLVAVWDSFYAESRLFRIDPSRTPAVITESRLIVGGSGDFDPEGVALAPDRTLWVASEGNRTDTRRNRLIQVEPLTGAVLGEFFLPADIEACRQAERDLGESGNIGSHNAGFEGIAILPDGDAYELLVAQQRGWDFTTEACEPLDDDPDGSNPAEPFWTRIWIFDPISGVWDHVPYDLAPIPANASWVGLSEITRVGDGSYVAIERDNRTGDFAALKTLVRVDAADAEDGVTADEKRVYDLIPNLEASRGWISDKPEGTAIDKEGNVYVVTDNDGVDDWSGETWFLKLGNVDGLFDKNSLAPVRK